MSKYLELEWDPLDQPAATDPVERRTWCALRIRVGGRTISRIWDRNLDQERAILYLPAFPIAEWIVQNWWALLNEPCRGDQLPQPLAGEKQFWWTKRHCLRSAESGLLLPALYLFHDGRGMHAKWQPDDRDSLPNMPGEFIDGGSEELDPRATEESLGRFVNETFGRVKGLANDRVEDLLANWQAIQGADPDETEFCVIAGRMGVDPYDPTEMSDSLSAFISNSLGRGDSHVVRDLTEIATAQSVEDQWTWINETTKTLGLGSLAQQNSTQGKRWDSSPSSLGYLLAKEVRKRIGLEIGVPMPSMEDVAITVANLSFHPVNHVPGVGVRAVIGGTANASALIAGPVPQRTEGLRFLLARGLYHALFACNKSERLLTDAFTWDQQASRAFAAELLAPREAVTNRTSDKADRSKIEQLAQEFQASTILIEKQLQNAGIIVADE